MEKTYYINSKQKRWSGYTNIKHNRLQKIGISRNKQGCFLMIKALIHQEDIMF